MYRRSETSFQGGHQARLLPFLGGLAKEEPSWCNEGSQPPPPRQGSPPCPLKQRAAPAPLPRPTPASALADSTATAGAASPKKRLRPPAAPCGASTRPCPS